MKQLLTFSLLVFGAASLHAQTLKHNRKPLTGVEVYRQHIMAKAKTLTPQKAKTTVIIQRVIGESGYTVNGSSLIKTDTTYFKYSNGRSSEFFYDEFYHNYYFPGNTDPGIDPLAFGTIGVNADTVRYYSIDTAMHLEEEMFAQYTPVNKVYDYTYREYVNGQHQRVVNSYDAQNRLNRMTAFSYNASTQQWDSAYIRAIQYNNQHEVIADTLFVNSMGDWLPTQVFLYTYTGGVLTNGMVRVDPTLAGSFQDMYSTTLEYYPNNAIKTIEIGIDMNGTGITPYERDSFAYDPQNMYRTFHQIWLYNNTDSAFYPYSLTTRNVNGAGIPDTSRFYTWDQTNQLFVEVGVIIAAYNSYLNPTVMDFYLVNGTVATHDYRYHFFYQDFDPTSVKTSQALEKMTVYPNPAQNVINIKWKADGKRVRLNIVNAAGQTVHSERLDRMKEYEQINLSHFTPGIYWLNVVNSSGQLIYKASILKQ